MGLSSRAGGEAKRQREGGGGGAVEHAAKPEARRQRDLRQGLWLNATSGASRLEQDDGWPWPWWRRKTGRRTKAAIVWPTCACGEAGWR